MKTKQALAFSLSLLIGIAPCYPAAWALPQGYESVVGNVHFSQSGHRLDVSTTAQRSIANYNSFNIGSGEQVHFNLPSAQAAILNRVLGGNPSSILGQMSGNGQIFLVNPAGVFVGSSATINVGSLFASTLDIKNHDFLSGNLNFYQTQQPPASVINRGAISVNPGGFIALTGGAIENSGALSAPRGNIQLTVGDRITAAVSGITLVDVTVSEGLKNKVDGINDAIANHGSITADGGLIELRADLASNLYQHAVNNTGQIRAQSIQNVDGEIVLMGTSGDQQALVSNTGTIDVSGTAENQTGGNASILGDVVSLGDNALIQASGTKGGGTINIGGNYQGKGPLYNAQNTSVGENVQLLANAEQHGDGGNITIWSDGHTRFEGVAEAKGGALSGNGGLVETSGKQSLFVGRTARVDASAANGKGGLWLMDPTDLTVSSGAGTDSSSQVFDDNIQTTLNTGTDVTLQTDAAGTDAGDITVQDGVTIAKTAGGDATLRMNAHESINFSGAGTGIALTSTSNKLNIILDSDFDNDASGGTIALTNTAITSNGGDITLGGGLDPLSTAAKGISSASAGISMSASSLNAATGNISLTGKGWDNSTASGHYGVTLNTGSQINTTTGNITVAGTGGSGTSTNFGIYLTDANTQIESEDGHVTVTGTGIGTGAGNHGVYLNSGGKIVSTGTGTTAKLDITGTGNGSTSNYGVLLNGGSSKIQSLDGDVTVTGTTNGGAGNNYGVYLASGQIVSTGDAKLDITGTGSNGNNAGNHGVYLNNGMIQSADGDVTVTGTAGHGNVSGNYGVYLNGGKIVSTGNAKLGITGTGYGSSTNYGVYLYNTTSKIQSADGDVTVTGTNNGTGSSNYGINLQGQILSTGLAKLNITGTGANGNNNNYGVNISSSSKIQSADGDVTVTGTGGNGSGSSNYGINLQGQILSTGLAKLNITGTGHGSGASNYGVELNGTSSKIQSADGNVTVTGTGGNGTNNNYGVYLAGGQIVSTGNAKLDITGTGGGNGTNTLNSGVLLGTSSKIQSADGDVTVTGTGGNGTNTNYGIYLNGGQIVSTGLAKLDINGTGHGSGASNAGIYLKGSSSKIQSADGDVTVTGTGGNGTGTDNIGLYLFSGAQIVSTDAANLVLTGIKGGGVSTGIQSDGGTAIIGSNTMTGDLSLITDDISLSGANLRTAGDLIFRPYNNTASIGLNGGTGTLQITNSTLGLIDDSVISPSHVIIGNVSAGTGQVTIGDGWDISGLTSPVEVYGGDVAAGSLNTGTNSLLLAALTGDATMNGAITSAAVGNAVTIAASNGNFLNNAGSGLFSLTGGGRWLVYSKSPFTIQKGSLSGYSEAYGIRFGDNISAYTGSHIFYVDANNSLLTNSSTSRTGGQAVVAIIGPAIVGSTAAAFLSMPLWHSLLSRPTLTSQHPLQVDDQRDDSLNSPQNESKEPKQASSLKAK